MLTIRIHHNHSLRLLAAAAAMIRLSVPTHCAPLPSGSQVHHALALASCGGGRLPENDKRRRLSPSRGRGHSPRERDKRRLTQAHRDRTGRRHGMTVVVRRTPSYAEE